MRELNVNEVKEVNGGGLLSSIVGGLVALAVAPVATPAGAVVIGAAVAAGIDGDQSALGAAENRRAQTGQGNKI